MEGMDMDGMDGMTMDMGSGLFRNTNMGLAHAYWYLIAGVVGLMLAVRAVNYLQTQAR